MELRAACLPDELLHVTLGGGEGSLEEGLVVSKALKDNLYRLRSKGTSIGTSLPLPLSGDYIPEQKFWPS
jgi:hypothetical protein